MSRGHSDFDAEDMRAKLRAALLIVSFAIGALLYWLLGHPTEKDWLIGFGIFVAALILEGIETLRQYIERLNEYLKERHEELDIRPRLDQLSSKLDLVRDDLRELNEDITDKFREADKEMAGKLGSAGINRHVVGDARALQERK